MASPQWGISRYQRWRIPPATCDDMLLGLMRGDYAPAAARAAAAISLGGCCAGDCGTDACRDGDMAAMAMTPQRVSAAIARRAHEA